MNDIGAEQQLAAYGTLGPGRPNRHHLAMIAGAWSTGTVPGHLQQAGRGCRPQGSGYRRVIAEIDTVDGPTPAYLHLLAAR